jgi:hypothetical protein
LSSKLLQAIVIDNTDDVTWATTTSSPMFSFLPPRPAPCRWIRWLLPVYSRAEALQEEVADALSPPTSRPPAGVQLRRSPAQSSLPSVALPVTHPATEDDETEDEEGSSDDPQPTIYSTRRCFSERPLSTPR